MGNLVLVVEDEQDLLRTLDYNLRREGYETRLADTGAKGLDLATRERLPDLVLLDLMLPDIAGTEVCRQLRAEQRTRSIPVMMLTAKGEEIDRVIGFELGADDYLTKPFSLRELLLRVRALLRRTHTPPKPADDLAIGRLRIDEQAHQLWVDDKPVRLTALEWRLLTLFVHRRGRVQTRETLLIDVWKIDADVTTRTVDTHVKRLRQKLGPAGQYIETLRGVGYCFSTERAGDLP